MYNSRYAQSKINKINYIQSKVLNNIIEIMKEQKYLREVKLCD
jgi:ribosomal protein S8